LEAGLGREEALAIGSTNLERLLGANAEVDGEFEDEGDLVVTQGGDLLEMEAKVVAVISRRNGKVNML
jgi:hypothetical protein